MSTVQLSKFNTFFFLKILSSAQYLAVNHKPIEITKLFVYLHEMNCELFNLPALSVGHIEMIQELLNIKADWVMSTIILVHLNLCCVGNN